jgi:hypothetical protein
MGLRVALCHMKINRWMVTVGLLLASGLWKTPPCQATLGQALESVTNDIKAVRPARTVIKERSGYSVHELQSMSLLLREYVSPSGVVFAITWAGYYHPIVSDTSLLGSYVKDYEEASKASPRGLATRHRSFKGKRIVVELGGHPRKLYGRVYDPTLIPYGMKTDEID